MNPPIRLAHPALLLFLASAHSLSAPAQGNPPRTALLIGVGDYDGATYKGRRIPNLPGITDGDLPKMEEKLESLGFAVTVVADPTLSEAKVAVDAFSARIKTNPGVSLFYFSGHGGENEGKNYLIPSGASIANVADLSDEALSAQRVLNGMEASGATVNLVFLDCCREDLGKNVGGAEMAPLKARGSFIGFATRSGDFADPEAEGSPYTRFLLKHIGTPGLSVPDMYGFVAEDLKTYSKRVLGEERIPGYYSELAGAPFYLVPGKAVVPEPATGNSAEMAALLARVEAAEKAREEAERRAAMAAVPPASVPSTPSARPSTVAPAPVPMVSTDPVPAPAFPASRGMEGTKAGDLRTFGGIEMVWCPPGEFMMGSPLEEEGRLDDENQMRVTFTRGFWMAKTECTQGQWQAVMRTSLSSHKGEDYGKVTGLGPRQPMYFVSWEDAVKFCDKLNQKQSAVSGFKWALPTEAQWEYACRAGTTGPYAGELDKLGWYSVNSNETTHEVGTKAANAWGLHDMHGNVWEWCADLYGDPLLGGVNPSGAKSGEDRVRRGGGWIVGNAFSCRAASRSKDGPGYRRSFQGFRPALVPSL